MSMIEKFRQLCKEIGIPWKKKDTPTQLAEKIMLAQKEEAKRIAAAKQTAAVTVTVNPPAEKKEDKPQAVKTWRC